MKAIDFKQNNHLATGNEIEAYEFYKLVIHSSRMDLVSVRKLG